ncbi:MAG: damage-control phosphatase ARMT1 family protein [Mahellales bacterium]|jgi:uncharacterized protein with ATP-grasp and redox domains
MKQFIQCMPCYLTQVISALRAANPDKEEQTRILKEVSKILPYIDPDKTPAENSTLFLLETYKHLGQQDPFREAKMESNRIAMALFNDMEKRIEKSADPLLTSIKLAVAGNIIDMGINPEYDLDKSIDQALREDFTWNDYEEFKRSLAKADNVLILGDNSGEIVFDKLMVGQLKNYCPNITYTVKGGPILNDATMEDALEVGMDKEAKVIDTGTNYIGVVLDKCSKNFLDHFYSADLIIGKGQGNYESLEGTEEAGDRTFFMLRAKCQQVAQHLGVKLLDTILYKNVVD